MKNATVLVLSGADDVAEGQFAGLADDARDMRLRIDRLIVGATPDLPVSAALGPMGGAIVMPAGWADEVQEMTDKVAERARAAEERMAEAGLSGNVTALSGPDATIAAYAARHALVSDVAVMGNDLRRDAQLFQVILTSLLFQTSCGVLLNPPATRPLRPRRVLFAWNASPASACALRAVLPLLDEPTEITVACIDPDGLPLGQGLEPGADVAAFLAHRGHDVTVVPMPGQGRPVSDTLRRLATDVQADLTVMGAYGRSRLRQAILGGTTRAMVEQTDRPVFLAH
ncbi:hypothetical protein OCGS_1547 [Oceaniovalibus guishaninsula JLT2003]|uniref:UspA domain-containing protein n=1 Tax=Oceaniovalibus guishaninsula JLT2003 TaxID=1231392 RepID=K2HPB5_9RHOB|nr:universal stress protein [Oceaniovalibus guishaninsula]EKE44709.1 hypothetical protein OCGS_1547 [Oceaniovalibus guishaninsula JLT2003]